MKKEKVGGSCVNYGCTPTKTLVASAKAFFQAKRGDFYGFRANDIELDYDRVRERMNGIRNGGSNGLSSWMENTKNVDLIRGEAKFLEDKVLKVNDEIITGKNIYINVGTRPRHPVLDGAENVDLMDSAGLLDKESLPKHLIILGVDI